MCILKNYSCCFIGHRKIEINDDLKREIYNFIENLITKENVDTFLFGSRSEFNDLCCVLVNDLKAKYPNIKKIAYTCKSETVFVESDRDLWTSVYNYLGEKGLNFITFDKEIKIEGNFKSSYIARNYKMIDDSDFCVFYYDKNYEVQLKINNKNNFINKKSNSGTMLAYKYARKHNKIIKNFLF